MEQDGNGVVPRNLAEAVHDGRSHVDEELLFADSFCAGFQVLFDGRPGVIEVGDFVGEEDVFLGVLPSDLHAAVVSRGPCFKAIDPAGGQQDGLGDSHDVLVPEHDAVGASGVVGVLVNVDDPDGLGVRRVGDRGAGRHADELPSVHIAS